MKLNFTWLNARKSLIFNSFIDFSLFSYFFLNAFKYSILNNSVLLILCFVNSFIWIISSYIIGRYENEQIKNTNIFIRQLLKTFLNISINILINQIIFRSFWNWDYMNFESFSNFLNVFLDFYKIIFIFSSLTQSLINLYLVKRFINKSTWLFLGTRDREKYFKNLISKKSKFKIRKYNYKNIISKSINVKGIIIDDDELFKKKDIQNSVVVATDIGISKKARDFANWINVPLAIVEKRRMGNNDKVQSLNVIGEVNSKNIILFDDEISSGGTMIAAAEAIHKAGGKDIYAVATHGVLPGDSASKLVKNKYIKEFVVTDTVPIPSNKMNKKIKIISIAPLLGEAIRRIHEGQSVGQLFTH